VALNVFMDYRRRLSRNALPLEVIDESRCFENPFERQESQRSQQEMERLLEALDACLRSLPQEYRDLILEYYSADSQSKVESRRRQAERLGIPSNALRIRACRIRTKLRESFAAWLG
jgi:DNA-directed RNA polymerase specialized sigma24 family protein